MEMIFFTNSDILIYSQTVLCVIFLYLAIQEYQKRKSLIKKLDEVVIPKIEVQRDKLAEYSNISSKHKTPPDILRKFEDVCEILPIARIINFQINSKDHLNCGIGFYYKGLLNNSLEEFDNAINLNSSYLEA